MEHGYLELNRELKQEFPDRYLDLIAAVVDEKTSVPVFTAECKFISQDCRHFTIFGAKFYAKLFEEQIGEILEGANSGVTGSGFIEDRLPR